MKTSRPFSFISYNTIDFLRMRLEELYSRNILSFYAFIKHEPEDDEKKDHIHIYVEPNGSQNTDILRDYFKEYDPANPLLPRGCLPARFSKFGDWYLYDLHNADYLASKGQSRKYHYTDDNIEVSDDLYFNELKKHIDFGAVGRLTIVRSSALEGLSFESLVMSGAIPIQQINQYEKVYYMFASTFRNGRSNHEDSPYSFLPPTDTPEK